MDKKKILIIVFGLVILFFAVQKVSAITETISVDDYVIDFEYDEDDVVAGETFRLTATVTNEAGETRNNIELSLDLDDPFDEVGDDTKLISVLDDDESKTVSFRIEVEDDANEEEYDIDFDIKDNKIDDGDDFSVEVSSDDAEIIIGSVESLPTVIAPDTEDIRLTIRLENTGGQNAEFVRAKLVLPEGFEPSGSYTDTANLGTISDFFGESVDFFIDSKEFVSSGRHTAYLELTYEVDGDSEFDSLAFDLPVKGRPQFLVQSTKTEPRKVVPGSEGKLEVTIDNIGSEEGRETSIRVFENSDQPFEYNEKTNFVGSLEPGESGSGVISFTVDKDASPKTYLVRAQVRTVSEGNVLIEEITLPVEVVESEPSNVKFIVIFVVIFVLLLVLVLWLTRKKN
ncbi:MAG: hypothetical protein KC506_03450 [Nanoarchaeota archaeon]|nr:hypothetical protein [Nanoarchaeota archaeon]